MSKNSDNWRVDLWKKRPLVFSKRRDPISQWRRLIYQKNGHLNYTRSEAWKLSTIGLFTFLSQIKLNRTFFWRTRLFVCWTLINWNDEGGETTGNVGVADTLLDLTGNRNMILLLFCNRFRVWTCVKQKRCCWHRNTKSSKTPFVR